MLGDDRRVPSDHVNATRGRVTTIAAAAPDPAILAEPPYLLTNRTNRLGVTVAVTSDATTAVVELAAHGAWSSHFGDQISTYLRTLLSGPSVSVIIDLHQLDDPRGLSMPFWMAAWKHARLAALPVDLVFCLPGMSTLAQRLGTAEGPRPRLFAGTADARQSVAVLVSATDRLQVQLMAGPECVRVARNLVKQACRGWGLSHLLQDTSLVASELAANAVEHAGTDFVVTLSRRGRRLHVAVQDGATGFPRLQRPAPGGPAASPRGRGLLLVHTVAAAWGAMPTRGGKVVWATLT